MRWLVVSTLCQETKKHLNRKVGLEGTPKLDPYWKLQPVTCTVRNGVEIRIMSFSKDNSHSLVRISYGLNKLVTILNNNEQETSEVQFEEKALRMNARFCKPIKGQSETTKTQFCQLIHKNPTYWEKNLDRCCTRRIFNLRLWSVEEINSSSSSWKTTSRKWWSNWILENHRQSSRTFLFKNISCIVISGLTKSGRKPWQEEEETRKDTSIVLIRQEQSCTSELFKAIQDAVSLILPFRTMLLFRAVSSNTFIMSDVQSIYILIINSGLIAGGQNFSNRQTVFFQFVDPMDKNLKDLDTIDLNVPLHAQYMHKAWKKHQNTVDWVDINLALKKDSSSIEHARTLSFFTKHSQLIVFRKLFGWKLEKSYTRKYMRHLDFLQRFLWNMIGWRNWVHKLLNDQRDKLFNNPKVPNQTNQIQTQIMIELRNRCLPWHKSRARCKTNTFSDGSESFNVEDETNHDRTWTPLFAVTQVTRKVTSNQCWTRLTLTSEYLDCHILLWNKLHKLEDREPPSPTSSSTRSTTKQSLQPIHYNDKEDDSGHGQRRAVWIVRDGPKTQSTACLSCWSEGIVYCTCGHLLKINCGQPRRHWI